MLQYFLDGESRTVIDEILMRVGVVLLAWVMILAACLVDFWSGCSTARAIGQRLNSHGFRKTLEKVGDYMKVSVVALLFDILGSLFTWYQLPYATIVVAVGAILIEGTSVFENSRRKKSNAAKLTDMAQKIVKAVTEKDAQAIIDAISKQASDTDKNAKWQDKQADGGRAI